LELPHDAHAIELGHLPVEKREVGFLLLDHHDGFASGRRLSDERNILERPQQRDQERSRGPFVVRDDDSEAGAHTATRSACCLRELDVTGMRTSTSVPVPGALSIESEAA